MDGEKGQDRVAEGRWVLGVVWMRLKIEWLMIKGGWVRISRGLPLARGV